MEQCLYILKTVKILTNKTLNTSNLHLFWHTSTFTVPAYTMPNDDSIKMTHCNYGRLLFAVFSPGDNDGGSGLEPSTLE